MLPFAVHSPAAFGGRMLFSEQPVRVVGFRCRRWGHNFVASGGIPCNPHGTRVHKEYWIPAEELNEFNRQIVGLIEVVNTFRGGSER
jgi:hypothetical protein